MTEDAFCFFGMIQLLNAGKMKADASVITLKTTT